LTAFCWSVHDGRLPDEVSYYFVLLSELRSRRKSLPKFCWDFINYSDTQKSSCDSRTRRNYRSFKKTERSPPYPTFSTTPPTYYFSPHYSPDLHSTLENTSDGSTALCSMFKSPTTNPAAPSESARSLNPTSQLQRKLLLDYSGSSYS
jgi:hypothetical protein